MLHFSSHIHRSLAPSCPFPSVVVFALSADTPIVDQSGSRSGRSRNIHIYVHKWKCTRGQECLPKTEQRTLTSALLICIMCLPSAKAFGKSSSFVYVAARLSKTLSEGSLQRPKIYRFISMDLMYERLKPHTASKQRSASLYFFAL